MICLGFDTSNYTTSLAAFDGAKGENVSRLLPVKPGELGLRQSEALFSHVKRLPELSDRLFADCSPGEIRAIGVSTRPRAVEGSYMPCFLAGESQARVLAAALRVPVYSFSHQQGHVAAVLWSAGRMDLFGQTFLAWHLSGGTTELLLVKTTREGRVDCARIGGTTDISAGQLIDRTGQLLGLDFPSGKALDLLAQEAAGEATGCEAIGNRQQATGEEAIGNRQQGGGTRDEGPGNRDRDAGHLPAAAHSVCQRSLPAEGGAWDGPASLRKDFFRVRVQGAEFSFSGVQNQVQSYYAKGAAPAETAYFALRSVAEAVKTATKNAQKEHPFPVIFSGGVASNSMLRKMMPQAVFGEPRYSTDNALGIAVLTWLRHQTES